MLFLPLILLFNFIDWFESGGWILCVFLPIIGFAIGYGFYQDGKRAGREEK